MYRSTSTTQAPVKETSSVEYHTSIIQSIEIVKKPRLFDQYDNDKSSRFFSSSSTSNSQTSVFDAIDKPQSQSVLTDTKNKLPNNNKRFKRLKTDEDKDFEQPHSAHKTGSN